MEWMIDLPAGAVLTLRCSTDTDDLLWSVRSEEFTWTYLVGAALVRKNMDDGLRGFQVVLGPTVIALAWSKKINVEGSPQGGYVRLVDLDCPNCGRQRYRNVETWEIVCLHCSREDT